MDFRVLDRIDVLVNNAGYLGNEKVVNEDTLEMSFAVNVLAPWCLTKLLLPALRTAPSARVLNITGGDAPAAVDVDNIQAEKGYMGLMSYTHAKSCLEASSLALARELEPQGVTVNIVFPGRASTAMTRSLTMKGLPGPMKCFFPCFKCMFTDDNGKSAAVAALSTIWACTTNDLKGTTGRYYDTNSKEQKLHSTSYDVQLQSRIVEVIESAVSRVNVESLVLAVCSQGSKQK